METELSSAEHNRTQRRDKKYNRRHIMITDNSAQKYALRLRDKHPKPSPSLVDKWLERQPEMGEFNRWFSQSLLGKEIPVSNEHLLVRIGYEARDIPVVRHVYVYQHDDQTSIIGVLVRAYDREHNDAVSNQPPGLNCKCLWCFESYVLPYDTQLRFIDAPHPKFKVYSFQVPYIQGDSQEEFFPPKKWLDFLSQMEKKHA